MSDPPADTNTPCGGLPDDGVELAPGVRLPAAALRFAFVRSSGPGGQNVNKRATKARLSVSLEDLRRVMPGPAVARLKRLAGPARLSQDEVLTLTEEGSRSQHTNRQLCIERLSELVIRSLRPPRTRRKTRPTKASKQRRVETKKRRAQIKHMRRRPGRGDDAS